MKVKRKKKVFGTTERPRLVVYRSSKNIYGQLIDDANHKVVLATSSLSKGLAKALEKSKTKTEASHEVGKALAKEAVSKKIENIVFDRNGYLYHGRIKSFAEGAREGGLKF